MFNFLRNWRKTAVERQQEMLHAYVDEALSPGERRQFEEMLAADEALQAELTQIRQMKTQLRQMPRRRVPRNFTLDPAVYGRPRRQPLFQFYPVMRTAMVLAAFFFIFAIAADLFVTGSSQPEAVSAPGDIALLVEDSAEAVEVTRVVVETAVEGEAVVGEVEVPAAVEEPAEEAVESEALPAAAEENTAANDMADTAAAESEATAKTAVPPTAGIASQLAATAPPPAPTALATQAANFAATEPADGSPRVTDDEDTAADRAMETTSESPVVTPTAVPPSPAPTYVPEPGRGLRDPWRPVQIGLGALFLILAAAVWYVRRNS